MDGEPKRASEHDRDYFRRLGEWERENDELALDAPHLAGSPAADFAALMANAGAQFTLIGGYAVNAWVRASPDRGLRFHRPRRPKRNRGL